MSWEELRDVQKIRPSSGAFAALLGSGKAGGWSNMKEFGGSLTVKHLEGFFSRADGNHGDEKKREIIGTPSIQVWGETHAPRNNETSMGNIMEMIAVIFMSQWRVS